MSKIIDRQRAIELRQQDKTYNEIKRELSVSKSTLSSWLSEFPLTKD
jgi:transposase-like protein